MPSVPFTQGETVTVSADVIGASGATPLSWSFTVADVDTVSRSLETPPAPPPPPKPGEAQSFLSRPDLAPPTVAVTTHSSQASTEDIFIAPYAGTGQYGPMILDPSGRLLWFKRLPPGARAADLRVQEDEGKPVLTWWQDPINWGGKSGAGVVIANSSYTELTVVRAGNGYQPDLHSFTITPQNTAFTTVYDAVRCNLSAEGGPANGAVADTVVQEIDLGTGLVRYEWHSLDHVPLSASYMPAVPGSPIIALGLLSHQPNRSAAQRGSARRLAQHLGGLRGGRRERADPVATRRQAVEYRSRSGRRARMAA